MDSWASSAKSYRNGARAINSAQLSVSLNYCNSTKVLAFFDYAHSKCYEHSQFDLCSWLCRHMQLHIFVGFLIICSGWHIQVILCMWRACSAAGPLTNTHPHTQTERGRQTMQTIFYHLLIGCVFCDVKLMTVCLQNTFQSFSKLYLKKKLLVYWFFHNSYDLLTGYRGTPLIVLQQYIGEYIVGVYSPTTIHFPLTKIIKRICLLAFVSKLS